MIITIQASNSAINKYHNTKKKNNTISFLNYNLCSDSKFRADKNSMNTSTKTDITVQSSNIVQGNYLNYPFVVTSFSLPNGQTTTSSHRITEGHIPYFTGLRISYLSEATNIILPSIVLSYSPVRNFHLTILSKE